MDVLKANWKVILAGLGAGVVGVGVGIAVWHVWADHHALHQIIDFMNANFAQAAKAGKP